MLSNIEVGQKVQVSCDGEIVDGVVRFVNDREVFVNFRTSKMGYDSRPHSKITGKSRKLRISKTLSYIVAVVEVR